MHATVVGEGLDALVSLENFAGALEVVDLSVWVVLGELVESIVWLGEDDLFPPRQRHSGGKRGSDMGGEGS